MAIIDRDGLFNGQRLQRCSDAARLMWPYLFLAANGFGRFEVDYGRTVSEVFRKFSKIPSEVEYAACIEEYRQNHLLFLYRFGGQIWGQWFCKEGSLPRWKTTRDKNSPPPPQAAYDAWIREYESQNKELPKFVEILPKDFRIISESLPLGIGEGVGVGIGVGKAISLAIASSPQTAPAVRGLGREILFERFWGIVWAKIGKGAARKVWLRKVTSKEMAELVIAAAQAQGPGLIRHAADNGHSILHPATWLNAERWTDEPEQRRKTAIELAMEMMEEA